MVQFGCLSGYNSAQSVVDMAVGDLGGSDPAEGRLASRSTDLGFTPRSKTAWPLDLRI